MRKEVKTLITPPNHGDMVSFELGDEGDKCLIIAQVLDIDHDGKLLLKERWAAHPLWGESTGGADHIHERDYKDVELYASTNDETVEAYANTANSLKA